MTPAQENEAIIKKIAREWNLTVETIRGKSRDRYAYEARKEIAQALYDRGLSTVQIGRYINREHTTILNMLGRLSRHKKRHSQTSSE
jgi:chromosomal replication initiation ATPase DnaA